MSREELIQRAAERAKAEGIKTFRLVGGTEYLATSTSEPGAFYQVHVVDGEPRCTCKGFFYRESCKHAAALAKRMARERK